MADDFYSILDVSPDASAEEIKERYRFFAQAYHPDKFTSLKHKKQGEERFKRINEAYGILSDSEKRAVYDKKRSAQSSRAEENQRQRDKAEAERQRRKERQQREQAEAERRRAEEERRKHEEAEAAQRRAEEEQQRREQAEYEEQCAAEERHKRAQVEATRRRRVAVGIGIAVIVVIAFLNTSWWSLLFRRPTSSPPPMSEVPSLREQAIPNKTSTGSASFEKTHAQAEEGDVPAQYFLCLMYQGTDVAQDSIEALKWCHKAAEQGYPLAQYELGVMYRIEQKAAAQGVPEAQYNLGLMYDTGRGVPQDYVQAHKWANLAASKGYKEAVKTRDSLAKLMTPDQIAEAQRLAHEWRPKPAQP